MKRIKQFVFMCICAAFVFSIYNPVAGYASEVVLNKADTWVLNYITATHKKSAVEGMCVNKSDVAVTGVYYNTETEETENRAITDFTILNADDVIIKGDNTFAVSYQDKVAVFVVEGVERTMTAIRAAYTGDELESGTYVSSEDLLVEALYDNGTTSDLGIKSYYTLDDAIVKGKNVIEVISVDNQRLRTSVTVTGYDAYTVAFDSNGGSSVESISHVKEGTTVKLPMDPYRIGYTFQGWYTNSKFTKEFTSSTKITKNMTVYAKWKKDALSYKINARKITIAPYAQAPLFIVGDEENMYISWISRNKAVARVDADGIVTGYKKGTTKIVGTTASGYLLECTVTVGIKVENVKVNTYNVKLKKGKTYQLKARVTNSNATTKKLKYSSSNKKVATVTNKGKIKAKKKGSCYIYIETTDSSYIKKKVKVTVK